MKIFYSHETGLLFSDTHGQEEELIVMLIALKDVLHIDSHPVVDKHIALIMENIHYDS